MKGWDIEFKKLIKMWLCVISVAILAMLVSIKIIHNLGVTLFEYSMILLPAGGIMIWVDKRKPKEDDTEVEEEYDMEEISDTEDIEKDKPQRVIVEAPTFDTDDIIEYEGNGFEQFEFRPSNFKQFIGQKEAKNRAKTIIKKVNNNMKGHFIINGIRGHGKCLVGNSMVVSNKGFDKIKSFDKDFNMGYNNSQVPLLGKQDYATSEKFYKETINKTIKIITNYGYELEGTPEHPILIWDKKCVKKFKKLKDIKPNDYVIINRDFDYTGKNTIPSDMAMFLGYIIADGNFSNNTIRISNSKNNIKKKINTFLKQHNLTLDKWGAIKNIIPTYNPNGTNRMKFKNKIFELLEKPKRFTARYKTIPKCILNGNKNIQKRFLNAYFEADGHYGKNSKQLEIVTASKVLAYQLQVLLLNFNIVCSRRTKRTKDYDWDYWRIIVSGVNLDLFKNQIGYSKQKIEKLKRNTNKDIIPYLNGKYNIKTNSKDITWDYYEKQELNYKEIDQKYFFDEVKQIKKLNKPKIVYDFTIPKRPYFFSNGFISHNTTFVHLIKKELEAEMIEVVGKQLNEDNLKNIINKINTSQSDNIMFFVDEIDSMDKKVIKILNPIIEQFEINSKKIKPFIFASATINKHILSKNNPDTLDRIPHHINFERYSDEEIEQIIRQYHKQLYPDVRIPNKVFKTISKNCKYNPRTAIYSLLEDYVVEKDIEKVLYNQKIAVKGLTKKDIDILEFLKERDKPIGANALAIGVKLNPKDYIEDYEPFLYEYGYIARVPSRIITEKGKLLLEKELKNEI